MFRTRSDTEVIVHGYKQWGDDVFNRLNGMFGLAIWDVHAQRLVVARDAIRHQADLLPDRPTAGCPSASEMRACSPADTNAPEVDPTALNLFLRYRYTPSPHTILKGIRKLAPARCSCVENGGWRVERWYSYRPEPFSPAKSDAEASEELLRDLQARAEAPPAQRRAGRACC